MPQPLLSPADIIARSIDTCRDNSLIITRLLAWFTGLSVVQWAIGIGLRTLVSDQLTYMGLYTLLALPASIIASALTVSGIEALWGSLQKGKPASELDIRGGFRKVLPFLWTGFVTALALAGGFILFIIPAAVFAVWFRFGVYSTVIDGASASASLQASKRLAAGRFLDVAVRVIIILVFYYIASQFALSVIYLIIGSALGDPGLFFGNVSSIQEQSAFHVLVTMLVTQLVFAFTLPAGIAADLILWNDLKRPA